MSRLFATLVFAVALAGPATAGAVDAAGFYCGSLSDAGQSTRLDSYRVLEYGDRANWIGLVKAPKFVPTEPTARWCREMYGPEAPLESCRRYAPLLGSGALAFDVLETLVGKREKRITVVMRPGVRQLLSGEFPPPEHPKLACSRQEVLYPLEGFSLSPPMVALDPKRDYLLMVLENAAGEPFVAAFGIVDAPRQTRAALRALPRILARRKGEDEALRSSP